MKTFLASKWCERIQIRKFDGKENPPDPLDAGVAKDILVDSELELDPNPRAGG